MRVLAGQIEAYVDQLSSSLPHRSRASCALLVVGDKRVPEPDVPSLAEVGATPFDGGTTLGLYVRAGTPKYSLFQGRRAACQPRTLKSGTRMPA